MLRLKETTKNYPGAYSFSQEQRKFDFQKQQEDLSCIENEPGPLSYQPNIQIIKNQAPQYSIQDTKKRGYYNKHSYLSPFHYNNMTKETDHSFKFKKEKRDQKIKQSNNLGPQFYNPNYQCNKESVLKYPFGYKCEQINRNKNPGPGDYLEELPQKEQNPNFSKDVRLKYSKKQTAGPGDYDPVDMKFFGNPQISFTQNERKSSNIFQNPTSPHDYFINRSIDNGPKPTIGLKLNVTYDQDQPGPGAYNPQLNYASKQYSINFAKRKDMVLNDYVDVAPNTYNKDLKNTKIQMQFSNYTFDTEFQKYVKDQKQLPGPGNYNNLDKLGKIDCQQYSVGKEKRFLKLSQMVVVPGPGNYYIKKKPQNNIGSFSKAERMPKDKKKYLPGPSDYDIQIKEIHPTSQISFTKSVVKKFKQPHEISPADYNTSQSMVNIPSYMKLRQSKDFESKSLPFQPQETM